MRLRHVIQFVSAAALSACILASCGGGDSSAPTNPNPTPTPTPQPGPPASLAVVTGDAQNGLRLAALPQPLAVLVKDAAGTALNGITVQFTVDSGGGTLSTSSATTGTDGIARGGTWTLGNVVGAQFVSARVGTLTPLRFRATAAPPAPQPLFTDRVVPTSGGTITYTAAGDPLNGVAITVPASTYPTSVQFTVTADTATHVALPADVVQVGPILTVATGQGFADSAMTLSMPLAVPDSMALVPFYYDSASSTLEAIPLVERTATKATLATHHFSRDLLAIPGNVSESASLRSALRLPFGDVKIVWAVTPKTKLIGTFSSNFRAGVDNWEFVNNGDYTSPNGACEGMSVTSMYYHFFHKAVGEPALYHHFDKTLVDKLDNVQGIRLAGAVQADYERRFNAGIDQRAVLDSLARAKGTRAENLTSYWILLTLKVTRRPVLLGIYGVGVAHAIVAYAATSTGSSAVVTVADPNLPETGRNVAFENGAMIATNFATRAGATPTVYTKAFAMSVTSDVPLTQISTRYQQFVAKNTAPDLYPTGYRLEYYDALNAQWTTLPATITTSDAVLHLRHICTACVATTTSPVPGEQDAEIWLGDGSGPVVSGFSNNIDNQPGKTTYYGVMESFAPSARSTKTFLDAKTFDVVYQPFVANYASNTYYVGDDITFTANGGTLETPTSRFRWLPDDGTSAVVAGKVYTYRLKKAGLNVMEVKLLDDAGKAIARAVTGVWVQSRVAITLSDSSITPGTSVSMSATFTPPLDASQASKVQYIWSADGAQFVDCGLTRVPINVCTFTKEGTYQVTLSVVLDDTRLAQSAPVTLEVASPTTAWRLTSFHIDRDSIPGALLPTNVAQFPDQGGITNSDHITWYHSDSLLMARLSASPATGVIVELKSPVTAAGKTYRAGLYLQSDPTGTPNAPAAFDPAKPLIPLAQTPGAPFPDVYVPPLLAEPYADVLTTSATAVSGSSIVQLRDFTGLKATLVAPQRKRTLLAWKVNATKSGTTLTGTMRRTQSLWVYFNAQGMYWYNLFVYDMSFAAKKP